MLMSALLHLPLPASSDARIPLEMLDLSSSERAAYDAWNWENVLTHHAFMDDAGGVHLDDLPSEARGNVWTSLLNVCRCSRSSPRSWSHWGR